MELNLLYSELQIKRAFGFFFLAIALAILMASIMVLFFHVIAGSKPDLYQIFLIWSCSFAAIFGLFYKNISSALIAIRDRAGKSIKWPLSIKVINGLSWAGPFILILFLPSLYQYLLLFGIGLGNFSTYLFLKKFSKLENKEQLFVSLISFSALPAVYLINLFFLSTDHDLDAFLSRLLISVAYGIGGAHALLAKNNHT